MSGNKSTRLTGQQMAARNTSGQTMTRPNIAQTPAVKELQRLIATTPELQDQIRQDPEFADLMCIIGGNDPLACDYVTGGNLGAQSQTANE